jgi:hypothetical protein
MKANVRSIVLILPLLLSSCVHKTNQAVNQPPLAPPIEDAPLPKPDNAPANLPPPVISMPDKKDVTTPPPAPKPQTPTPAPKHKKPATKTAPTLTQTPTLSAQTTEQASNASASVPAIGNLSSGEPADLKDKTESIIADTEKELNGINRKLNEQDSKTSDQIRAFLKQARTALSTNDVDGAHTLALKAQVLLNEINQ